MPITDHISPSPPFSQMWEREGQKSFEVLLLNISYCSFMGLDSLEPDMFIKHDVPLPLYTFIFLKKKKKRFNRVITLSKEALKRA